MLIRSNEIDTDEFIHMVSNEEIVVYEDVQGSKIWVNYINNNWQIRPKSINNDPINLIDLATQKFYKHAYAYLFSLPDDVTNLLRSNLYFCFEYFPDEQPANIEYDRVPKNRLILTCINKYKKKYTYDINELKTYADLFGVETLPIIYNGKLSEKQIKLITYFLYTSSDDIPMFFKSNDFTEFFYKLLNPFTKNSYLKNGFQSNLEKIIIRYVNSNKEMTLEILNPMYQRMQLKVESEYSDVYSLLIFNFIQWLLTIDINELEIRGNNRELIYINLMSELFNQYIKLNGDNIINFKFTVPEFFNSDKFRINQLLIQNKETIDIINTHSKFEYLFKILLSNFKHKHKKKIGILNDAALKCLNELVDKISIKIETQFSYNKKLNSFSTMTNLDNYPNIKWEADAKGYVYPQVDSLFGDSIDDEDKKKLDNLKDKDAK
jgi:hypothetical protein